MLTQKLALALAAYVVPAFVHAADVVELIPADALGFVTVNRLAHTDETVQALGQRMQLPIPSLASLLKTKGGIAQGVDESGALALVLLPASEGPAAVLYVPVDDYDTFIEQLEPKDTEGNITTAQLMNKPVIVGRKNNYALIAWPNNLALLQGTLSKKDGTQATSDIVTTLQQQEHHITAVLTSSGIEALTTIGQEKLAEAKAALREQFDSDHPAVAGLEVYVQLLSAISVEVAGLSWGLQLDGEGAVRVNEWVWIQPSGTIATTLRDVQPHEGDLLAGLPNIPYVFAFGGVVPAGTFDSMMDFSGNMMKAMPQLYGLTPEQVDRMLDLSAQYFSDPRGTSFCLGVGREGTPLYSEMLGALHVPDAQEYVAKYRKYWEELDELIGDAERSFFTNVTVEDVDMDGIPALKISMPIPLDHFALPNRDELDSIMEKFYGPGGISIFLAAADDETVLMAYTDMTILRQALAAAKDESKQISQAPLLVSTARQLPTDAHIVAYWSPSGTIEFVNRLLQVLPGPAKGRQLPAFPETPPVGSAMTATSSALKFNTVVPAEIIAAVGTFVAEANQPVDVPAAESE